MADEEKNKTKQKIRGNRQFIARFYVLAFWGALQLKRFWGDVYSFVRVWLGEVDI